jgi:hypothetical protein
MDLSDWLITHKFFKKRKKRKPHSDETLQNFTNKYTIDLKNVQRNKKKEP